MAEIEDSVASALSTPVPEEGLPLPSQGEPVAWLERVLPHHRCAVDDARWRATTIAPSDHDRKYREYRPLYTAEALAAERARADSLERERDVARECHSHALDLAKRLRDLGNRQHAAAEAAEARADRAEEAIPRRKWHEDDGAALWWALGKDGQWLGEAPWAGSPLDEDWPGYHTHYTPLPAFPSVPTRTILKETAHDER